MVAALKSAKDSKLVACTRRVATSLKDFQERHQIPKGYAHVSDLLRDPEIDAVYLATPVALHHQHALEAAMQGKHVLCEKPMALDSEKCRQMIQVCRQRGVKLGVCYYRRFYPVCSKIQELLRDKRLGEIVLVRTTLVEHTQTGATASAAWRFDVSQSGGGLLMDMASH